MPILKLCNYPNCRETITTGSRCSQHQTKQRHRDRTIHNHQLINGKYLYNTTRWRKLAKKVLTEQPLCRICELQGYAVSATQVDHIKEIQDHPELTFTYSNLQPLCASCHARKSSQERMRRKLDNQARKNRKPIGAI